MSMNLITLLYLVASVCFIQALKGLSHPTTSRRGNLFGMIGMGLAVLTTVGLIFKLGSELATAGIGYVIVGLLIGGSVGTVMAKRVEMTKMPELVAFMHSMIGLAAVFIAIAAVVEPQSLGIVEQIGTPFEIYNRPATPFVAGFVGSHTGFDAIVLDPAAGRVSIDGTELTLPQQLNAAKGATIRLALRPEAAHLGPATGRETLLHGRVAQVQFMGSIIRLSAMVGDTALTLDTFNRPDTPPPGIGAQVEISVAARDFIVLEGGGPALHDTISEQV